VHSKGDGSQLKLTRHQNKKANMTKTTKNDKQETVVKICGPGEF